MIVKPAAVQLSLLLYTALAVARNLDMKILGLLEKTATHRNLK